MEKTRARQSDQAGCRAVPGRECREGGRPAWNVGTHILPTGPGAANDGAY